MVDVSNLPPPPPDRRSNPKKEAKDVAKPEEPKPQMDTKIMQVLLKNITDLRTTLGDFQILKSEKKRELIPDSVNIILFGPTGSGKSSLIKTFYQAYNNLGSLSETLSKKLVVKGLDQNEGTRRFTESVIKEGRKSLISAGDRRIIVETSSISAFDTRGQILMDKKEMNQLELQITGKIQDMAFVEQRTFRYAYLLWEFWKKDSELFPEEIFRKGGLKTCPHVLVFVFDGSLEDVPNGSEETRFYREIIERSRSKSKSLVHNPLFDNKIEYFCPQIVLTRVDKVEEKLEREFKKKALKNKDAEFDKEARLREIIDSKIEAIVQKLNIPRSSVHFIENYHENKENSDVRIDYYALKLLEEAVKQGESFIAAKIKESSEKCVIF